MHRLPIKLFIILSFIYACDNGQDIAHNHPEAEHLAVVTHRAGDVNPDFKLIEIPTFFNLGEIKIDKDNIYNTIILGDRINNQSSIPVNPLALLSFEQDSTLIKFIVSTQMDNKNTLDSLDYNTLMLKHPYLKRSIESWFMLQCEANQCRNFKWDNTYKALLEISKNKAS